MILVGGANGKHKGGKHVVPPEHTPLANLHLTMLDKLGIRAGKVRQQHWPRRGSLSSVELISTADATC